MVWGLGTSLIDFDTLSGCWWEASAIQSPTASPVQCATTGGLSDWNGLRGLLYYKYMRTAVILPVTIITNIVTTSTN